MPIAKKTFRRSVRTESLKARKELFNTYHSKYFNLWMASWKWEGLDKFQNDFLMRKLWHEGTVAAFEIVEGNKEFMRGVSPEESKEDNALLGFASYATQTYSMYGFPATVRLVNERGTPYVDPGKEYRVHDNVALIWALKSRQSVESMLLPFIERIVEVEMTIRTNLFAHKIPYVIGADADNDDQAIELMNRILDDDPYFVVKNSQSGGKPSSTGQIYIIDKLYAYKTALENECHTLMGIDNLGAIEKKERLIGDEVNKQDAIIDDFSDSIGDNLKAGADDIEKYLGYFIKPVPTSSPREAQEEDIEEKANDEMTEADKEAIA